MIPSREQLVKLKALAHVMCQLLEKRGRRVVSHPPLTQCGTLPYQPLPGLDVYVSRPEQRLTLPLATLSSKRGTELYRAT